MEQLLTYVRRKQEDKLRANPVPLQIQPITRSELKQRKYEEDEINRQACFQEVVEWIYKRVLNFSKTTSDNSYKLQLVYQNPQAAISKSMSASSQQFSQLDHACMNFILENTDEVMARLHSLFPDSSVEIKTLSRAPDGKMYDTSSLDANALRFINRQHDQTFLIIDWS
jgi:hypothetical protein